MTDYTKLVEALRFCFSQSGHGCGLCPYKDHKKPCDAGLLAADAIEALQAQLPKRGEWIDSKERMRPDMCSACGCIYEADRFMDKIAWNYCPNCGADMRAKMDGPIITPCRGCSDYDGYGGCKSKGGCARAKLEVQDESQNNRANRE